MCTQKPPHDYSQQLYDKHREVLEEYITSTVRIDLEMVNSSLMFAFMIVGASLSLSLSSFLGERGRLVWLTFIESVLI